MPADQIDHSNQILWYFADPMCSWCWGFSPVIEAIKVKFKEDLKIGLILGGLRPGNTQPVTDGFREEILQHWRHVNELSGQPFTFAGAMPDGFVYDTEPPSRAVVAVGEVNPELVLAYFKSVQHAFYVEQKDVTQEQVLCELVRTFSLDEQRFLQQFHDDNVKQKTQAHFYRARQSGVRGFPTLILEKSENHTLLTHGYRPYTELEPKIQAWLDGPDF